MSGPFGSSQWMYSSGGFYPFEPTGSLRFEDGKNPRLQRTPTTSGNRKTWTFACWFKVGNQGSLRSIFSVNDSSLGQYVTVNLTSSDYMYLQVTDGSAAYYKQTNRVFRDSSAWYHLVWSVDTTQSTAADRVKVYINGEEETSFSTSQNPSLNANTDVNHTLQHQIGNTVDYTRYFDGYMAEIYLVDGTAHDADAFGQFKNGVWIPKDAKGSLTFGTNGFYLPFNSTVVSEGQSTVLYEGAGSSQSVQGMGYKPDFVWLKNRSATSNHALSDRVRGASRTIYSNLTAAQDYLGANQLGSFNDDGFTILGGANNHNDSGEEYVAWAWDAGADQAPTGFGCVTYHGAGNANRAVRDVGFTPDLVWVKTRDAANAHNLFDSVRGATKRLRPNTTDAEVTDVNAVVSFDDDGFTVDTNADYNGSSNDYVAWCWDAGDGDAVSNTDGDITSTVKASDTHGFSITSFTGNGSADQTVGHGLSSAPEFIILKDRDSNSNNDQWQISSSHIGDKYGYFTTAAFAAGAAMKPTSGDDTTFTTGIGPNQGVINTSNESGDRYIAYLWHSVSGYSKFGTYTGNGSATGPTVTLGFRPALVLRKRTDAVGDWVILDTTRDNFNNADTVLSANKSNADTTVSADAIEVTSTGFQIKGTGAGTNANGGTYFYAAFAGGLDTIAPVNTDGDIDSRVKASDDTGFSIIRYEGNGTAGATIGHGLSSAPDWVMVKELDNANNWRVWHTGFSAQYAMALNTTGVPEDSGNANGNWNNTEPTNSVITLGSFNSGNRNGGSMICYAWTATTGKSAFGSYTGNGSATGPSITGLGFEPSLIIIKQTSASGNGWNMFDNYRHPNNPNPDALFANANTAETTNSDNQLDFNSDGFQLKGTGASVNANNATYIYMAFADGKDASFFHDESGQDNHFEPENVQNYDVVPDSPTNNFATMNPVDKNNGSYAEGNLKATTGTVGGSTQRASYYVSSGKWYYEFQPTSNGGITAVGFESLSGGSYSSHMYQADNGQYYNGSSASSYGATYGNSDIIGIALDADNQTVEFFKNGVSQGELSSSNSGMTAGDEYVPFLSDRNVSQTMTGIFNFGQDDSFAGTVTPGGYTDENERGSFKYPVPSGFLSLCTQNLPDPAIDPAAGELPEDYFNTVLYTGTGAELAVSNVGFQPDWVWIKERNAADPHRLYDSVRGATKAVESNTTAAEITNAQSLKSFDSDGFTLGTSYPNNSGDTYVAWNWLAGGSAVSNTDGSITSSVSANTKAGFSIVTYTGTGTVGATVGHGLGATPAMIIIKSRSGSGQQWPTFHHEASSTDGAYFLLNKTDAVATDNSMFNNVNPTSSVFTVTGGSGDTGRNGSTYVAYCFTEIEGYSKIGSYTGNGSSDGAFVHCGFKPAWVMIKRTDAADHWGIEDIKRSTYNEVNATLYANLTNAEYTGGIFGLDFVSNGFKLRTTDGMYNASGGSYIYLAYADNPFKYAQAR